MSDMENKDMAQAAAVSKADQEAKTAKADAGKKDKTAKKAKDKPGFFDRMKRWFREMKSELKKVSWPSAKTTMKNVGIVIACVIIVGVAIGVFDVLVKAVVDALLNLI